VNTFFSILDLLIGAGIFLVGIIMFGDSVKKNATQKTRKMFDKIGNNRIAGFGLGMGATLVIQSSSATTVMVVGLVSAGMMSLFQGMAVMLGAHVGTLGTQFLVALGNFPISALFMVMAFIGVLIKLSTKDIKMQNIGEFLIGFGVLFVGLRLMGGVFRGNEEIRDFFMHLFRTISFPLALILLGMVFTMIIQSSSASIAIFYTMFVEGLIGLEGAVFLACGAHIGTSITAILASLAANRDGKRVAVMNTLFSAAGVAVFTCFVWPLRETLFANYAKMVPHIWQLPVFLLLYHFFLGLIKIWFITPMLKFVRFIIKESGEEKPFGPTYLQDQLVDANVEIATDMAKKEILITADLVKEMFEKVDMAFKNKDMKLINEISKADLKIGILHRAIIPFLAKISNKEQGDEESKRTLNYLYIQNELESIGDVIDEGLMLLVKKMVDNSLSFSEQGSNELAELHKKVMDNLNRVVEAFASEDALIAKEMKRIYSDIGERKYQLLHVDRLHQGIKVSIDSSSIHLDVITNYARINTHLTIIAERILCLTGQEVT